MLLGYPGVDVYLDSLDPHLAENASRLTDYLRGALSECTHLLAAVSPRTKDSWWVPFEIGLATERDYPICTYALGDASLPDYLRKWPYLRTKADLDRYVQVARARPATIEFKDLRTASRLERANYAVEFHSRLRSELGQT